MLVAGPVVFISLMSTYHERPWNTYNSAIGTCIPLLSPGIAVAIRLACFSCCGCILGYELATISNNEIEGMMKLEKIL